MRKISYFVAFAVIVLACCRAAGGADDAKKLQGTWEVTDLTVSGKKVDLKVIQGTKFVFDKDKLAILPPNDKLAEFEKRTFSFKIDPKKKPAEIDLTALDGEHKGVISPGIYEIQGETLRWCQPDDPKSKDRPKQFAAPDKSDLYLFTLKRTK